MTIKQIDASFEVLLDAQIYNVDTVHKCFYWYSNLYFVEIEFVDSITTKVLLTPKNEDIIDFHSLSGKIRNDMIDFKLRDIVTKETMNVRDLLIAKAFAYYETENNPTTDVSDPVGFNPNF
jgi:His-Xaa-Ser system protein HxsD